MFVRVALRNFPTMNFYWHLLFTVANWIPTILAYNLIFGKGKVLHFGPMGVILVSSYASVLTLQATGSFVLAFFAGLSGATIISALFAWLSFRLEPDGFGMLSIAVHLMILAIVLNWTSLTRGALGIPKIPRMEALESLPAIALTMTAIAVLWIMFMLWLDRSSFGRQIAALAEHEWHAQSLGISRIRIHLIAFLIAGLAATIVSLFYVQYVGLLHPNDYLFPTFIFYVMCVVAGNPGSVKGVTLSIIALTLLKEGLRFIDIPANIKGPTLLIIFGLILFAAVWWRRDTIFPVQRSV